MLEVTVKVLDGMKGTGFNWLKMRGQWRAVTFGLHKM